MGEILKSIFPGLSTGVLAGLTNQIFGLSRAEKQQNQFNAFEAQKQRDFEYQSMQEANAFNAEQAQMQRDFQASQYQTAVKDMKAAGVNPALAIGGVSGLSGASAASAMPSGAAASGSGRGLGTSLSEVMQLAMMKKNMEKLDAEIENTNSVTRLNDANTQYRGQELEWLNPMKQAEYDNLLKDLENKDVQKRLAEANINETEARRALEVQQSIATLIDNETRGELNKLQARLRISEVAQNWKRVEVYQAEITELLQRAITESCQARNLDAQTENLFEELGIIQLDKRTKEFEVKNQKVSYWTGIASQVLSGLGSIASGYMAAGVGSRAFGMIKSPLNGFPNSERMILSGSEIDKFNPYVIGSRR